MGFMSGPEAEQHIGLETWNQDDPVAEARTLLSDFVGLLNSAGIDVQAEIMIVSENLARLGKERASLLEGTTARGVGKINSEAQEAMQEMRREKQHIMAAIRREKAPKGVGHLPPPDDSDLGYVAGE